MRLVMRIEAQDDSYWLKLQACHHPAEVIHPWVPAALQRLQLMAPALLGPVAAYGISSSRQHSIQAAAAMAASCKGPGMPSFPTLAAGNNQAWELLARTHRSVEAAVQTMGDVVSNSAGAYYAEAQGSKAQAETCLALAAAYQTVVLNSSKQARARCSAGQRGLAVSLHRRDSGVCCVALAGPALLLCQRVRELVDGCRDLCGAKMHVELLDSIAASGEVDAAGRVVASVWSSSICQLLCSGS